MTSKLRDYIYRIYKNALFMIYLYYYNINPQIKMPNQILNQFKVFVVPLH